MLLLLLLIQLLIELLLVESDVRRTVSIVIHLDWATLLARSTGLSGVCQQINEKTGDLFVVKTRREENKKLDRAAIKLIGETTSRDLDVSGTF